MKYVPHEYQEYACGAAGGGGTDIVEYADLVEKA